MLIFREIADLRAHIAEQRLAGKTIGFVPTMGALHEGHLDLIHSSNVASDVTVCTIFVNPAQFNEQSDFDSYPIRLEEDAEKLESAHCDVLYIPAVNDIYPEGEYEKPDFDFGGLDRRMEGEFRPGHFVGVGEVIKRFLEILDCDKIFLGEKDFQQVLIIKSVIDQFGFDVEVVPVPTKREKDGLAMSSRNLLLKPEARKSANKIYETLRWIKNNFEAENMDKILEEASRRINESPALEVEYLSFANAQTLDFLKNEKEEPVVVCTAVWAEGVRLIDNIVVK